jgi:transposase
LAVLLQKGLSVEAIATRFDRHPSTISYWMEKHGLVAVNREKHAARGGIERERLEELVEAGMSIAEIAVEVGRSKATVRHWLTRHGLKTLGAQRRRRHRAAREDGNLVVTSRCRRHGEVDFVLDGAGQYRCRRCRAESVSRRRRKLKATLVSEAGGACIICGYGRYVGALEFHHVDPTEKRLGLGAGGLTLSIEAFREEARKCVLLCSNCHAEVEGGVTRLPVRVDGDIPKRLPAEPSDPG